MRAQLKQIHTPELDLNTYWPNDPSCFGFLLQAFIGVENEPGYDSFSFIFCSPKWLEQKAEGGVLSGAGYLILAEYDRGKIEKYLRRLCERCLGNSWQEIASKLVQVGSWEFEDCPKNLTII
jgi:hypothetical protein